MVKFELKKYYFDCITNNKSAFIGYAAKVRYGFLRFNYGTIIIKEKNKKEYQKQCFSFGKIKYQKNRILWKNNQLNLNAVWANSNKIKKKKLFNNKEGIIEWQCLKPNAKAKIDINGKKFNGRGYVEKLHLTIPPWKLPFNKLYWGRFISDNKKDYRIWISWFGKTNKNWLFLNKGISNCIIKEGFIEGKNEKLILKKIGTIKSGNVLNSLLKNFYFLSFLFPRNSQKIIENKYLSKGMLISLDKKKKYGVCINELVKWA
jgi:hypothetical protein